jgi:plasmid maintenance system antidote protein VapI
VFAWHTFVGTQGDNMYDSATKGLRPRKLSPSNVFHLRALRRAGVGRDALAAQFGISPNHVSLIVHDRAWLHLVDPDAPPLPTIRPWVRKAECLRGHAFDAANTYIDRAGNRHCRACDRENHWLAFSPKSGARRRKFSPEFIQTIRTAYATGGVSQSALARQYGIGKTTVNKFVRLVRKSEAA